MVELCDLIEAFMLYQCSLYNRILSEYSSRVYLYSSVLDAFIRKLNILLDITDLHIEHKSTQNTIK